MTSEVGANGANGCESPTGVARLYFRSRQHADPKTLILDSTMIGIRASTGANVAGAEELGSDLDDAKIARDVAILEERNAVGSVLLI
jgi:hypothetical protein